MAEDLSNELKEKIENALKPLVKDGDIEKICAAACKAIKDEGRDLAARDKAKAADGFDVNALLDVKIHSDYGNYEVKVQYPDPDGDSQYVRVTTF